MQLGLEYGIICFVIPVLDLASIDLIGACEDRIDYDLTSFKWHILVFFPCTRAQTFYYLRGDIL